MKNNITLKSKRLAYLLRHSKDFPMDDEGWASVTILEQEYGFSKDVVNTIVTQDDKGRFEFSGDNTKVRATYGHSNNVQIKRKPTPPPPVLYHGTSRKALNTILQEGLKPRSRQYVHLSTTVPLAMSVGARHGEPVVLSVNSQEMAKDGYIFYNVTNNVWLTPGVAPKYLSQI